MSTIDEKRVYADKVGKREVYAAAKLGVAVASVADDRLGGFELALQCDARDVAAMEGRVAVATDEDVLVGGDDDFTETGFGPATAVGFDGGTLLAASEGGRIARREGEDWTTVGTLDAEIRAIDGDLLATSDGVFRVREADVLGVGLADASDISTPGIPLAATSSGLYRLGNGWMDELDGDFRAVAVDSASEPGSIERAHAATQDSVFAFHDDEWHERDLPVDERVVDIAVSGAIYAITDAGTLLIDAGDGWRAHPLGLRDARRLAVA